MTSIQRYHRLKNEYDHYERRHKLLYSITLQKRGELENLINHINQLLLLENKMTVSIKKDHQCVYDHGDHSSIYSFEKCSFDEDEESNDPLLQRLKLTKPTRLKTSSRQILNNNNTMINFTDSNILDEIHTVYDEYLSE
jgi:dTDP-glucose pyrophosphorylase